MKNKLPEKVRLPSPNINNYRNNDVIFAEVTNEIIDYLAELTELVEGKRQAELVEVYREILDDTIEVEGISNHAVRVDDIKALAERRGIDISDKK